MTPETRALRLESLARALAVLEADNPGGPFYLAGCCTRIGVSTVAFKRCTVCGRDITPEAVTAETLPGLAGDLLDRLAEPGGSTPAPTPGYPPTP